MTSARPILALVRLVLLAAWLGASVYFSTAVARAAFAVLPTRALAGALVGRVLPVLAFTGVLLAAALPYLGSRTTGWSTAIAASRAAMLLALVGMVLVMLRIDRLRRQMGGPIDSLAAEDPLRVMFGRLHGVSVGLLGIAMIAALVALTLMTRALGAALSSPRS